MVIVISTFSLSFFLYMYRFPIDSYNSLVNGVQSDGQIYEIEINYAECDTGEVQLDSIAGALLWQNYIDLTPGGMAFSSLVYQICSENLPIGTLERLDIKSIKCQDTFPTLNSWVISSSHTVFLNPLCDAEISLLKLRSHFCKTISYWKTR